MAERRLKGEVAVVGGGVAGLVAASRLVEAGVSTIVLDKGRRPGGRLSTKIFHDRQFDFGAQYLRPHSRRAAVLFSDWRKAGVIKPWKAQAFELPQRNKVDTSSWHVAVPSQGALAEFLARGVEVCSKFTALDISGEKGRWSIIGQRNQSAGPFQAVLVACHLEETVKLLRPFSEFEGLGSETASRPCFATMVEFEEEVMVDFEAAFLSESPLAWVCRDSSKPERPHSECWVLHATEEWSARNLDESPETIASKMLSEFAHLSPVELPPVSFCRSHRWRCAYANHPLPNGYRYEPELGLGLAGDWCNTPNVDGAYWSGYDLAEAYLATREHS